MDPQRVAQELALIVIKSDITEELDHDTFIGGLDYESFSKNDTKKFEIYTSVSHTNRDSYYGGLGGGRTARMVNPNPDFERASKVTPDDILNVFKKQFNEGVFFKGRRLPKSIEAYHLANPEMPLRVGATRRSLDNLGKNAKASKVSSVDIMAVCKEKFDDFYSILP